MLPYFPVSEQASLEILFAPTKSLIICPNKNLLLTCTLQCHVDLDEQLETRISNHGQIPPCCTFRESRSLRKSRIEILAKPPWVPAKDSFAIWTYCVSFWPGSYVILSGTDPGRTGYGTRLESRFTVHIVYSIGTCKLSRIRAVFVHVIVMLTKFDHT
jgi:hypothetical protein